MITLTRLSGSVFVLNSDLIERIDSTPDTVVTLVDGKKYVVCESLQEIIEAVRTYRSEVVAFGSQLADPPHPAREVDRHAQASVAHRPTLVRAPHGEA